MDRQTDGRTDRTWSLQAPPLLAGTAGATPLVHSEAAVPRPPLLPRSLGTEALPSHMPGTARGPAQGDRVTATGQRNRRRWPTMGRESDAQMLPHTHLGPLQSQSRPRNAF